MSHARRSLLAVALASVLAGGLPSLAGAHSIVRVTSGELSYISADATSLNSLSVAPRGGEIQLRDPAVVGGSDPGPCRPGEVTSDANAWVVEVFCAGAAVNRVRIDLGEREDAATVSLSLPVTLLGGPGADRLRSGDGADVVGGGDGNDSVAGGAGADVLDGGLGIDAVDAGSGDDRVSSREGLEDRITCGEGADRVEADTRDVVAGDCELVQRLPVPPPGDSGTDDGARPRVQAGGSTLQRIGRRGRVRVLATSSERGFLAASGFLDAGGLSLPLQSDRRRVSVAGGGAILTVKLSRRQLRECRRVLARGRRVSVRLGVVATDLAGNSAEVRAPRIRLLP